MIREVFDAYMRFGGMPGIADVGLDQEKAMALLEGIKSINLIEWLAGGSENQLIIMRF